MYTGVKPEVIGVFGLIITVWVCGLEQLGFGMKGADHQKVAKTLAMVAFWFGGVAQLFTAVSLYLTNVLKDPGISIYLATIFADYGLFWIVVACFWWFGGEKKQLAHFFVVQLLISLCFTYVAFVKGLFPLNYCLLFIDGLFLVLPFLYYGVMPVVLGRVAGVLNILIGIAAVPLFLKQLLLILK